MKQFSSLGETRAKAHPASKRRDRSGLIMAGVAVLLFVVVIPGNTPLLGQFTYTCSIGQSVSYSSPNMTIDFSFFTQSTPPGAGQGGHDQGTTGIVWLFSLVESDDSCDSMASAMACWICA